MIKVSDYIFKFIAGLGVRHIFLLPGGGCMHMVDSLGKNTHFESICCLHEQAAVIAAEAYGQYTNAIGVALVTTGPGGTNAITGVAGGWIDSTRMLILSGQVKRADMINDSGARQIGAQEVDIVSIVKPLTKYAVTVIEPSRIRYHLEKAVYSASSGRPGPVWVDVPLDVQAAMVDEDTLGGFKPPGLPVREEDSSIGGMIDKAVGLLSASTRPVILAGNGIRLSGALSDFIELIGYLKIPVLTTWKAIDFLPEDHGLFFGRPGSVGQRGANFIQQNADLIITIGARLDLAQAGYNYANFAPGAKKIIIDIDPAEIKKLKMRIDLAICLDAQVFIKKILQKKSSIVPRDLSGWLDTCRLWKAMYPVMLPEYWSPKESVNAYVFIEVLSELMSENDILVPESSGGSSEITMQSFKVKNGQRVLNSPGLGSMGFGLPAAIGTCVASGRKHTVTIIGDGALQHNIQELETIARLRLPLAIFIVNNNGYASIRNTQKNYFAGHYVCCDPLSGLTFPDTSKIAGAYGIKSARIVNHECIKQRMQEVLEAKGPIICEIMADPFLQTAPRLSSEVRSDGSIVSKPMEDLWPFLDREEFAKNMITKPLEE